MIETVLSYYIEILTAQRKNFVPDLPYCGIKVQLRWASQGAMYIVQ
jgi:hypothetical protein